MKMEKKSLDIPVTTEQLEKIRAGQITVFLLPATLQNWQKFNAIDWEGDDAPPDLYDQIAMSDLRGGFVILEFGGMGMISGGYYLVSFGKVLSAGTKTSDKPSPGIGSR